jgi:hypothetical protein
MALSSQYKQIPAGQSPPEVQPIESENIHHSGTFDVPPLLAAVPASWGACWPLGHAIRQVIANPFAWFIVPDFQALSKTNHAYYWFPKTMVKPMVSYPKTYERS